MVCLWVVLELPRAILTLGVFEGQPSAELSTHAKGECICDEEDSIDMFLNGVLNQLGYKVRWGQPWAGRAQGIGEGLRELLVFP